MRGYETLRFLQTQTKDIPDCTGKVKCEVVAVDFGSSGTKININSPNNGCTAKESGDKQNPKVPGISNSSTSADPNVAFIKTSIAKMCSNPGDVPIYAGATAGMRHDGVSQPVYSQADANKAIIAVIEAAAVDKPKIKFKRLVNGFEEAFLEFTANPISKTKWNATKYGWCFSTVQL
jgi:hypothetical protein